MMTRCWDLSQRFLCLSVRSISRRACETALGLTGASPSGHRRADREQMLWQRDINPPSDCKMYRRSLLMARLLSEQEARSWSETEWEVRRRWRFARGDITAAKWENRQIQDFSSIQGLKLELNSQHLKWDHLMIWHFTFPIQMHGGQKWIYPGLFGEGNGNPLQCSCLENPRDRGAWWAAVYGVAQSRTRLKWCSSSSSSPRI